MRPPLVGKDKVMAYKKFTQSAAQLKPDTRYHSRVLAKFINVIMLDGKDNKLRNHWPQRGRYIQEIMFHVKHMKQSPTTEQKLFNLDF